MIDTAFLTLGLLSISAAAFIAIWDIIYVR